MSRTTRNINYITKELDRISGLDGIVADKTEKLAIEVHEMVEDILDNHANASIFDYEGKGEKLTIWKFLVGKQKSEAMWLQTVIC